MGTAQATFELEQCGAVTSPEVVSPEMTTPEMMSPEMTSPETGNEREIISRVLPVFPAFSRYFPRFPRNSSRF